MFNFRSIFSKLSIFLIANVLLNSTVLAGTLSPGGTLNFAINGANPIPTLSGTMLILMSVLLFVVAFRVAKNKTGTGSKFFVLMIGTAAMSVGMGGFKVVSEVEAGGPQLSISLDRSGSLPIPSSPPGQAFPYLFENNDFPTGVTITSVVPEPGFLCGAEYLSRISNRFIIQPGLPTLSREITKGPIGRCGLIGFPEVIGPNVDQKQAAKDMIYQVQEPDGVNLGLGNACGITCGPDLSGPENTAEACSDNFDNDGDGNFDNNDNDCLPFAPVPD